jgi:hypothetical protein
MRDALASFAIMHDLSYPKETPTDIKNESSNIPHV